MADIQSLLFRSNENKTSLMQFYHMRKCIIPYDSVVLSPTSCTVSGTTNHIGL